MIRALAVACAALALVAAGCGGDQDEYETAVAKISTEWQAQFARVGDRLAKRPDREEIAEVLGASSRILARASSQVRDLSAPDEVQRPHDLLVEALRELSGTFRTAQRAAQEGEEARMQDVLSSIDSSPGNQKLRRAAQLYKDAGYSIDMDAE